MINAMGFPPTKPQITKAVGPDGRRACITTKPSTAWCILLHDKPHAMDVLPPIPDVLQVHGQGLTSMGHTQYTRILFIQASEHPSCETRFGENCKTTKPSSVLSITKVQAPNHAIFCISWHNGFLNGLQGICTRSRYL